MVHYLFAGMALCGAGQPLEWPEGDRFVSPSDGLSDEAVMVVLTCQAGCREAFPKIRKGEATSASKITVSK